MRAGKVLSSICIDLHALSVFVIDVARIGLNWSGLALRGADRVIGERHDRYV